jgi:hypothetical protein
VPAVRRTRQRRLTCSSSTSSSVRIRQNSYMTPQPSKLCIMHSSIQDG